MVALSRRQLANAIRALSMDAVQKANSGHPGAPMGMADIAEVLWNDYLRHNPQDPNWLNRDRFVLSNGHGSMLLYSLLHLSGYDVTMSDLQAFRQLHSKTPGHPEYGYTPGVETTTGPLGQGFANAVGMALAERALATQYNRDGFPIIDHWTYVFLGDGCLMEGVSHEAASFAGSQGLGKLIAIWDDNGISIDGPVKPWFGDDTPMRFESYGWQVIRDIDGHNPQAIKAAMDEARANTAQPTLICCRTIIGFGAPNLQGKEKCHGAALGENEVAAVRETLGWSYPPFVIPSDIKNAWDATQRGTQQQATWQILFNQYQEQHPHLAQELMRRLHKTLPQNWQEHVNALLNQISEQAKTIATRKASQLVLESIGELLPELMGGSADLTDSNLTAWGGSKAISPSQPGGNYLHYGVREFGMAAMMNGMALYGGFIPYGGTFLTFVDYARNAVRMAALMKQRSIFVFTHDSIGLGEDGPTHQPIEHITMLRATPQLHNWRPCDATETVAAWQAAIERVDGPTTLILTRQAVKAQPRTEQQLKDIAKGGYVLQATASKPDVLLLSTGSEVDLCMEAAKRCLEHNIQVQVVSLPCFEMFRAQDAAYQEQVLPKAVTKRVAVEAGATLSWHQYVGPNGRIMGIDRFGESAPSDKIYEALGLTVENITDTVMALVKNEG
ncbi:transketolase [Candidatus Berkiella aquae]|uniref:Transketolase n=1 Tax=Candidatus Berkiella aquae TaxID=295108 RepID=A0AAE3HYU1_9GAMM|nr:transketolase [Candidatus Berkiella aquae]MCS5712585.1 transketolase [Candidatus Berkiella aquae]